MNKIEKIKFSEETISEAIKKLRAEDIIVHNVSDFSKSGYSIMLSVFIPFPENYLSNKKVHELTRICKRNYNLYDKNRK